MVYAGSGGMAGKRVVAYRLKDDRGKREEEAYNIA